MKKIAAILSLTLAFLLMGNAASAQDNQRKGGKDWRDRMKAEKIAFLTDAMDLTSAEAERFWPVYNKCEAEKKAAWTKVMKAYKDLQDAMDGGKVSKEDFSTLLEKYFKAWDENRGIDEKYSHEYLKILSAEKVARLYIGEENFRKQQIHRLNK